jgi:transcriptional regulator with XRE-family HTH domain
MNRYKPRIHLIREKRGISQTELAKKINVSQSLLSKWETGKAYPRFPELRAMATVLKCSIEDLYL